MFVQEKANSSIAKHWKSRGFLLSWSFLLSSLIILDILICEGFFWGVQDASLRYINFACHAWGFGLAINRQFQNIAEQIEAQKSQED